MSSNWYVLDLETTGFDARREEICEVSISQVSYDLEILHRYARVMTADNQEDLLGQEDHNFVREMHAKSGLLADMLEDTMTRETTMSDVDDELTEWFKLSELGQGKDEKPIIIGSTIGFDVRFIIEYFPKFYKLIHHRTIDVSSLKELARIWTPDLLASVPEAENGVKHRATDDTENTLAELKHYKQLFDLWNLMLEQRPLKEEVRTEFRSDFVPVPPLAIIHEYCKICEKEILSMTYKGTGVCSVLCAKKRDGDTHVPVY